MNKGKQIFRVTFLITGLIFPIILIGLLLLEVTISSPVNDDSGFLLVWFALCCGFQSVALVGAIFFRNRERSVSSGLFWGLILANVIMVSLFIIRVVYVCQILCPPGLTGG